MLILTYIFNLVLISNYDGGYGEAMEQQTSTETFEKYWQAATAMVPETQVTEEKEKDYGLVVVNEVKTLQAFPYSHWEDVSYNHEVNFSKNHLNIAKFHFFIEPGDKFTKKALGIYFYIYLF